MKDFSIFIHRRKIYLYKNCLLIYLNQLMSFLDLSYLHEQIIAYSWCPHIFWRTFEFHEHINICLVINESPIFDDTFRFSFYLYFLQISKFDDSRYSTSWEQEEKENPLSLPVQKYSRTDSTGLLLLICFILFSNSIF